MPIFVEILSLLSQELATLKKSGFIKNNKKVLGDLCNQLKFHDLTSAKIASFQCEHDDGQEEKLGCGQGLRQFLDCNVLSLNADASCNFGNKAVV